MILKKQNNLKDIEVDMYERLDQYDVKPKAMINYLSHYGWHFNRKMCKFALKHLLRKVKNLLDKERTDIMLQTYDITLENNQLYDYVYVINYALSMYFESSLPSEKYLILYLKDTIDSTEDGLIFTKWYSTMCKLGIPID